jgi:hypothetical protein
VSGRGPVSGGDAAEGHDLLREALARRDRVAVTRERDLVLPLARNFPLLARDLGVLAPWTGRVLGSLNVLGSDPLSHATPPAMPALMRPSAMAQILRALDVPVHDPRVAHRDPGRLVARLTSCNASSRFSRWR